MENIFPVLALSLRKAVYTILGVGLNGKKEILGLYLSENEGANSWLQVLF